MLGLLIVIAVIAAVVIGRSVNRVVLSDLAEKRGVLAGWNILLVSIDTLRADRVGCYGGRVAGTPVIDRLAKEGIRFVNAISAVPLTLPSHATMLTGLNPPHHGVRNNGTFRLGNESTTLAELLASRGYRTAAMVSAFVMDRQFGLAQGFEDYDDDLTVGDQPSQGSFRERRAEITNRGAIDWLRKHGRERFFLFVHYFDPHWPYAAPSPFKEQYLKHPYDGEIAYVDQQIGRLLDALDETGARSHTLVVLTSDHGESLGEHGELSHGVFIYDATQRVPLIVSGSSRLPQGVVMDHQVGLVDIVPTVLDLLGIERPSEVEGHNMFQRPIGSRLVYMESLGAELMHGCAPLFGVRSDKTKFVYAPKPELYDLRADPGEVKNLYAERREEAETLYASLRGFAGDDLAFSGHRQGLPLSEEAAERLRALGYIVPASRPVAATSRATTAKSPADPKDMIVHLRRSQQAQELIMRGDFEEGLALLKEHIQACPEDLMAMHKYAETCRTVGRLDESLATYRRISAQAPSDADAIAGAASVLLRQGKVSDAEKEYGRIQAMDPQSLVAMAGLGSVQAARKQYREALATFQRVASQAQGYRLVSALTNIGSIHEALGQTEQARQAYARALQLDRGHVPAAAAMSRLDMSVGDGSRSIESLREAIERSPSPDGYLTLGRLLRRQGKAAEAEEALRKALSQRPDHAESCYELGALLAGRAEEGEAERLLRRCIELNPEHVGAPSELGMWLARRGQLDEAERWLARTVELAPQQAASHYNVAIVLEQLGKTDEALRAFRRAGELDPRHVQGHYHAAELLAARGQRAEAIEHLRKALALNPNYAEAVAALRRLESGG